MGHDKEHRTCQCVGNRHAQTFILQGGRPAHIWIWLVKYFHLHLHLHGAD